MLRPGGRLFEQRAAVMRVLDGVEGVRYVPNAAAFYLFPGLETGRFDFADAPDFALRLLEQTHILVVPGTGFDWQEDLRFRIVMLPEPAKLERAMTTLAAFLEEHRVS
jgi:alanine-synthesizing transaminase